MTNRTRYRVGVIGRGFVGGTHCECFRTIADVCVFDKNPERSDVPDIRTLVSDVGPEGIFLVAVNTPMAEDGSCDTSGVESVVRELDQAAELGGFRALVCIKSTCVPGTTERLGDQLQHLDLVFSPEFLTEQNALGDLLASTRVVIGGRNPKAVERVAALYRAALPKATIVPTSAKQAEAVKYFTNVYLAVKVALANEFAFLCERLDIDYHDAIRIAQYDARLGRSHWAVPGPDACCGFGGHCLPKDLSALAALADQLHCPTHVMRGAWLTNLAVRPPQDRDWERMPGRAVTEKTLNGCAG